MNKMFTIKDISGQNSEISSYAGQFLPYAQKRLGFNKPVGVNFISDPENAKNPLGKTAYYDPNKMEITIFVDKRHVKDILRSLSHELVHHSQNCRGDFDSGVSTEPGYAQKDPHMRKMEAEAYLLGNGFLFRDWEDQLKQKKENITMSEGYKRDEDLEEGKDHPGQTCEEAHEGKEHSQWKEIHESKGLCGDIKCPEGKECKEITNDLGQVYKADCVDVVNEDKKLNEEGLVPSSQDLWDDMMSEPGEELPEPDPCENWMGIGPCPEEGAEVSQHMIPPDPDRAPWPKNESWRKGNKDKLMFETLMKKWIK